MSHKPIDRQLAKNLLGLPPDKQIVLFGAVCSTSEHEQNGYLAQPYEVEDLAKGITWVLEDNELISKAKSFNEFV